MKGCTYAQRDCLFSSQICRAIGVHVLDLLVESLWRSTGFEEAVSIHRSHATFPSVGLFLFTTLPMCDDFTLLP